MNVHLLIGITAILVLGLAAQWLAWRINIPSILILIVFGFLIGPIAGLINPDTIFGDLLFPIVSLSVAVILYEGGLSLNLDEFRKVGKVVRNLIIFGIFLTWTLGAAAAYFILDLELALAILLGAILVVTGPTVIIPLLRVVRPNTQINSVLKWEGILNDPVGALLAVLVFEGIVSGGIQQAATLLAAGILKTILFGGGFGLLGAYVLMLLLKHRLLPEYLQNPTSLTLVITVFSTSNMVQAESGLFAVTVMGIFLANQKKVKVYHIIEFKENLRVLLISVLFIILAARLQLSDINSLGISSLIFLAILILIIRPVAVMLSTIKSPFTWGERFYLSWMAPRGIVAAAVASLFALELAHAGYAQAERLVPITFMVIVGTIAVYGLSAMPLAKRLKIANPNPQGCIIIGAHPFARAIAHVLLEKEYQVLLVDTNRRNISKARKEGLPTYYGSVISEYILNEIDLTGIGRLLAMTPNPEVNSLATLYFERVLGSTEVYQLAIDEKEDSGGEIVSQRLRGQLLFDSSATYSNLMKLFQESPDLKITAITEEFDYQAFKEKYKTAEVVLLFLIDENKNLVVITSENQPTPQQNQELISLIKPNEAKNNTSL